MGLHQTYELYLEPEDGAPRLEVITCPDEVELLSAVQDMIAQRGLRSVEVRRFGSHLFTVTA
jgi:hypothetical protein